MDWYPNESTLAAVETPMRFPSPRNDCFAIAVPARVPKVACTGAIPYYCTTIYESSPPRVCAASFPR